MTEKDNGFTASSRRDTTLRSVFARVVQGCRSMTIVPAMAVSLILASCAGVPDTSTVAAPVQEATSTYADVTDEWVSLGSVGKRPTTVTTRVMCMVPEPLIEYAITLADGGNGDLEFTKQMESGVCVDTVVDVTLEFSKVVHVTVIASKGVYLGVMEVHKAGYTFYTGIIQPLPGSKGKNV